jgi:homospermidine synthase
MAVSSARQAMATSVPFTGRILVIGCGGVSRCTLPLLLEHLNMPRNRITILDALDYRNDIQDVLATGVQYVQEQITQDRYAEQLAKYVGPGDMILDLAWNIGTADMLDWCHHHGVMYINTSVELWNPYARARRSPTQRTLYVRHMAIRKMARGWQNQKGPTAILEHGANPGLVSHFTKTALIDIAEKLMTEKPDDPRVLELEEALNDRAFNHLAHRLGVKVIHISEKDTQITAGPKPPTEFLNTWSVEGLYEEAIAPAEMGWGTHEASLPSNAWVHRTGPRNQICLDSFGMNTYVRSRVPSSEIVGMVIRHGEAFTISDSLTVADRRGRPVYRPTVHYAYMPSPSTIESLDELRERNYSLHERWKILDDEIEEGWDVLGCLLMGHDFKSWWTGSILTIDEARRLVPGQNATTLQVAASVVAAVSWMIRNPAEGVKVPDQLPHEEILDIARPYLGDVVSVPIDWMPTDEPQGRKRRKQPADFHVDEAHWQFDRFVVNTA